MSPLSGRERTVNVGEAKVDYDVLVAKIMDSPR